ncbi:UDP-4-amino-4-deoxy-L-arabinose-oxoglutarate aminotransferase [Hartmannibacter diazotrophicus]|uniref:UDP-4-amino-4-deoxy-L-arabinose-oxoglutarate aminotransferase n=1 Tax=Hartmannibacter diazotrophicus TaxID=1482074 RepID=A0A2C9D9L2_9HYPH|nr:DegT/DnrJ/EryC1/StrS family aminotransferase [Hartmannibacter diazotrophicus]SON56860.1 UDP-4-amino-4-deoxy-L-arabinose-oxoglutarate aminotransferase [Hartmannibacter diazotrophicus]
MKVDFFRHGLGPDDAAAIADVLATPFLTSGAVGRKVEAQLAAYYDLPHALLTNSWTNGAVAVLLALGVGPGDEVIIPAMTFIATANVVKLVGATPVMADVDPGTLLLTAESIAAAITPRTRAVVPVHLYGQMCDMRAIRAMVDRHHASGGGRIAIVEDCAHCFEGRRVGERPGRHSDVACFSFYATKAITCGEGGGVICRDDDLAQAIREARLHGMSAAAADRFAGGHYNHWDQPRLGTKANLPDLLAALLPPQIERIDSLLPERERQAQRYLDAFKGSGLRVPTEDDGVRHARHLFPVGVPAGFRDEAITLLNEAGVGVTVNYRAVAEMTYYRGLGYRPEETPVAALWGSQTFTLPLFPGLSEQEQDHVIAAMERHILPRL